MTQFLSLIVTLLLLGQHSFAAESCNEDPSKLSQGEKIICAQSFAELCGVNVVRSQNILDRYDGFTLLFNFLMTYYPSLNDSYLCEKSLELLESIGPAQQRTDEVNALFTHISLGYIGGTLSSFADRNKDGVPDVDFESCNSKSLPASQAFQLARTLSLGYKAAKNSTSYFFNQLGTGLDYVYANINQIDPDLDFLMRTPDFAHFSKKQEVGIRTLIKEGEILGLGYCPNFVTCLCN